MHGTFIQYQVFMIVILVYKSKIRYSMKKLTDLSTAWHFSFIPFTFISLTPNSHQFYFIEIKYLFYATRIKQTVRVNFKVKK
jgi:hypothetical protein